MDSARESSYKKFQSNLDEMVKSYRQLLDLLRKEKELLIEAKIDELADNNRAKETLIYKLRTLDGLRERYAKELALVLGGDIENPRLLELAQKIGGDEGDKLRGIHSTLDLIIRRVREINSENEQYARSGLRSVDGAMGELKDTLTGKKTYERRGKMQSSGPERSGHIVSKEA